MTIAHSPDADDIFMYYAIKFGWVTQEGVEFDNIALDIETLNVETLAGTYDISAISFALYPLIKDDYALLRTAVSFGEGYGPKLIKRKGERLKRNFKVALSGKYTTNALLFRIAYPDARVTYMNFLDIEEAVRSGTVHAGVLIHESILTYSDELEVEKELWDVWQELCEDKTLPLPLGGMAIRRSIPLSKAIAYENTLTKAVEVARERKEELCKLLVEQDLVRIEGETLDKYLELYANDDSITLSDLQFKAINKLYELGYRHGYYSDLIKAEDYTIPTEYLELRKGLRSKDMDSQLVALGVETFKIALYLSLPGLLVGMFLGLAVSIFQATTQINEMTLSFIPKIIGVVIIIIVTMPWMLNMMIEFTIRVINMIPEFVS